MTTFPMLPVLPLGLMHNEVSYGTAMRMLQFYFNA